jgi:cellulose 1,4-beta-cellobiosidase
MKFAQSSVLAFAASALAAPSLSTNDPPAKVQARARAAVTLDASTNVWKTYKLHPNKFYRDEVNAAVGNLSDSSLAAAAKKVADIGTFLWIDSIANIAKIEPAIADVPATNILGLVIYDLPGRDCAAKASNGELKVGELSRYKSEYIDRELTISITFIALSGVCSQRDV